MSDAHKVIIIGTGPAGYTAAVYAARANLKPLIFAGAEPGGQLTLTTHVENYPGFPEGILGPELMEAMRKQAERFGAKLIYDAVTKVNFMVHPFEMLVGKDKYTSDTVIISTGASAQLIGLESERQLLGHGVCTCATCDGAFFRNQDVMVVGGGDTAMEDSTFITKYARSVTVVHRRDRLRASKVMQERALKNPKIQFIWNSVVEDIHDPEKGTVTGVTLRDVNTGRRQEVSTSGVFVAIGHKPNTEIFKGQLDLDEQGYIRHHKRTMTNIDGVFAAGDVVDHDYRQAITAAGMGCQAAMDVEKYLEAKGH